MLAPSGLDSFDELRSDGSLSNEAFAQAVFELPFLSAKWLLVERVLSAKWRADLLEDALQVAALSVYRFLVATRGWSFIGASDDALGRWFYTLIHQHAVWALLKTKRGIARRRAREQAAARSLADTAGSHRQWQTFLSETLALIEGWPEPRRTVALDLHFGIPVPMTAQTCGLSERRIYELRQEIIAAVRGSLVDPD